MADEEPTEEQPVVSGSALSEDEARRVVWVESRKTYVLMPEHPEQADYDERREAAYAARQAGEPGAFTELEVHPHAYLGEEDFDSMPAVMWVADHGTLDGSGHFELHEGDQKPHLAQQDLNNAYTESIKIPD